MAPGLSENGEQLFHRFWVLKLAPTLVISTIMSRSNQHLVIWLSTVCAVIFMMIIVGGLTRLTQSGLSMVDWRPIMGIIPPISTSEWKDAFDAYKSYPEYQKINMGMTLPEFKTIFYWEYGHRVIGRLIGLIFFLPFVIFLLMGKIKKRWVLPLWFALFLGGLQGLMGWYMVKSGLVDVPHVSHYRLAAHLSLALIIVVYLFWLMLDMLCVERQKVPDGIRVGAISLAVLLSIQFVFGAFTAGLDAGRGFNTWPLMHGQLLADAGVTIKPLWLNLFENGVMIQFVHRWMGALLVLGIIGFYLLALRQGVLRQSAMVLLAVTSLQFLLGVLTLLHAVPVFLASLHQGIACLLVLVLTYIIYVTRIDESQM